VDKSIIYRHASKQNKNLLETAKRFRNDYGFCPFAVRDKIPVCEWKPFQNRLTTDSELTDMFDGNANGIGLIPGPISGNLSFRDFDKANSYQTWADSHPTLARELPTDRTGRGNHLFFRGPSFFKKLPDGEYIGDSKHYVVVPPSSHPIAKRLYEWLIPIRCSIPCIDDPVEAGLIDAQVTRNNDKDNDRDNPLSSSYTNRSPPA
jgi:hypothetical protein